MAYIKNLEDKVKITLRAVTIISITALAIVITVCTFTYKLISDSRKSIYVLYHDVPLIAKQTNVLDNRLAEYRAHVELFHNYFFTLAPDDKFINSQMRKAIYLCDQTAYAQMNNLKEKGYFNGLINGNAVTTVQKDSIIITELPKAGGSVLYHFMYIGKQRIERTSDFSIRTLKTEGDLKDMPRTDNNPHGVLIMNWKTLENKTLESHDKTNL